MDSILSTSIICPSQFCRSVYIYIYISAYCDAQPEASGDNRDYEACIVELANKLNDLLHVVQCVYCNYIILLLYIIRH